MGGGAAKPLGPYRHYEQDGKTFKKKFLQCLDDVEKLYNADATEDGRAGLGRTLEGSYVILAMCDTVADETAGETYKDKERFKVLQRAMEMLEMLTKCSEEVAATVMSHGRVVPVLLQKLGNTWKELEMNARTLYTDDEKKVLVPASLRTLHNISTYEQHVPALRKLAAGSQSTRTASPEEVPAIIDVMHTYLNSLRPKNRLAAIAILANTAKDKPAETKGVTTNPVILQFLVNAASRALKNEHLSYKGWTAGQLLHVLRTLGQKHLVKMALVNVGILDLLEESLESPETDIREESMRILLGLSVDNDCVKKIAESKTIVQSLQRKRQIPAKPASSDHKADTTSDELQTKNSEGEEAEWILLCLDLEQKDLPQDYDCFLSYNWTHQTTAKKLYDCLTDGGLNVWMDERNIRIGDSLKKSMATGVLQSSVFIMCGSTPYTKSVHCRREAVIADRHKKKIFPVLMENRQAIRNDDPWFDEIMKDMKYLDISQCHNNERMLQETANKLLNDLNAHLGKDKKEQPVADTPKAETEVETHAGNDVKEEAGTAQQLLTKTADQAIQTNTEHDNGGLLTPEKGKSPSDQNDTDQPDGEVRAADDKDCLRITHKNDATSDTANTDDGVLSDSDNTDNGVLSDTESAEDGAPTDRSWERTDMLYKRYERNLESANSDTQAIVPLHHSFRDERRLRETTDQGTQSLRPLTARSTLDEEKIRSWKRGEIQDWLDKSKLKCTSPRRSATCLTKCSLQMYHCPMCLARPGLQEVVLTFKKKKLDKLTGDELVFLHKLRQEAPEMFYDVLRKSLQIRSLTGTSKFIKALESLETE